ncbi:MAG TPA: hypothetical protein VF612_10935 [Jatrophihabitans sp.]|jgi:hypothetical protein|uniref:hypothetical protein n=1 Tax=Jatrophihabitans sp. TaxID=1932789 RepID=UPI002F1962EF
MQQLSPTSQSRILIVGYGDLGKKIANALVLDPRIDAIGVTSRSDELSVRDSNLLRFTAMNHGYPGEVSGHVLDLEDTASAVDVLDRFEPTMVVNCASVQSWRRLTELPSALYQELDEAQFGPWLPMHLAPARALGEAVRAHGGSPVVVNCAFPDAVGPVLTPSGLAPTIGGGNVANVVPALTWSASKVLGLPAGELQVRLVAQHYYSHRLPRAGDAGDAPAAVEIRHGGRILDISEQLEAIQLGVSTFCRRTGGIDGQSLTASSVLSVLRAFLSDRPRLVHAPAPGGLPGGYPVLASRSGFELSLPEGLTEAEAISINQQGQYADGVQAIDPATGAATIRADKLEILERHFKVNHDPIEPSTAWQRAHEMHDAFSALQLARSAA